MYEESLQLIIAVRGYKHFNRVPEEQKRFSIILTGGPANPAGPAGPGSPRSPWERQEKDRKCHDE